MNIRASIESPEPSGVKISRKNTALVTITSNYSIDDEAEDRALLDFFMSEQKPGWGNQFKRACILGP